MSSRLFRQPPRGEGLHLRPRRRRRRAAARRRLASCAGNVKADVTGAGAEGDPRRARPAAPGARAGRGARGREERARAARSRRTSRRVGGIAGRLAELVVYGLPGRLLERLRRRGAEGHRRGRAPDGGPVLDPARATLVIVGTSKVVSPQLAGLPIGKVEVRAAPGAPPGKKRAPVRPPAAPASPSGPVMPPPARRRARRHRSGGALRKASGLKASG